ncbi:kinase-like domain-containing protein [Diaporthe sp. PMI_573]|nr:kinase-like domain-containing protein [Diaporthaceae sp. PMI_573]
MDMPRAQPLGGLDGGFINAWSNDLKVQTKSDDTGSPSSEAESSTAVYDGGDSGQLRQRRTRSASYPAVANKEQLIKDVGSNFVCSNHTEVDTSEPKATTSREQSSSCDDTTLEPETEDGTSLENRILGALEVSSGRHGRRFLPFSRMENILTYDAILKELQIHYQDWTPEDLQSLAHEIFDEIKLPDSNLTTRRKIFGTLVRINKAAWITQFIEEGLCDSDLPFYFPSSNEPYQSVVRITNEGNRVSIQCFTVPRWKPLERELFEQYQWEFQAPFFQVTPTKGQRKRPIHYALRDNSILPFTEDFEGEGTGSMYSGGYSEVWRVRIHPAHHSHPSSDNPYFAVKRLRPTNRTLEMFKQEVATLKRLSERNHAHLMRLELTYEYQERFHLLFRWADGNLRDYWERHPRPTNIPRTHSFAVWVSQQCLGLAEALMIIHECPPDSDLTTNDETNGLALQRTNGRHGDIKPENILWFQPHECNDDRNKDQGKLVISDFGLTEFHRDETGLVSPMNIAMSPTYSAPEYEVSETISQSFDIWSMGCVLLEFFVWYMKGFQAFDQFSRDRAAEDNTVPIRRDNYFKVVRNAQVNDGRVSKEAVLKKAVASQFESLRQHPEISEFIVDALDFIEEKMLRMGPEKRSTSKEVVERFREIYKKASADAHYCLEPVPGRPKRVNTDLSTLAPHVFNPIEITSRHRSGRGASIDGREQESVDVDERRGKVLAEVARFSRKQTAGPFAAINEPKFV